MSLHEVLTLYWRTWSFQQTDNGTGRATRILLGGKGNSTEAFNFLCQSMVTCCRNCCIAALMYLRRGFNFCKKCRFNIIWITFWTFLELLKRAKLLRIGNHLKKYNCPVFLAPLLHTGQVLNALKTLRRRLIFSSGLARGGGVKPTGDPCWLV